MAYRTKDQVGTRIVELRDGMGLSQADLANELNFSRPVLCRIEKGERGLGAGEALELAEFFGVSVDSLLRDEEAVFVLRSEVDNENVHAALAKFDRDIDTLLALEAVAG